MGTRLEKEKRKGGNIAGSGTLYPPLNINVLPSHPAGVDLTALTGPIENPGFRDLAVKEYGQWLASNVTEGPSKLQFDKRLT